MGIRDNLENMLAAGKDNALLRYSLGAEYLKEDAYEPAGEHLARAVAMDPEYSAAWKLYGKALASAGHYASALDAFDRGIEVAMRRGDVQAAKEMKVFRKRVVNAVSNNG